MPTSSNKRIRVLFIDDDGSIRILAAAMFNNNILDIRIAANTEEAEKLLKEMSFDVIVCDVMMPGEDGLHFCERLKKSGNAIPFLFLSALGSPDAVSKGLDLGANAYFVKPFDAKVLQNKIIALARPEFIKPSGHHASPKSASSKKPGWLNWK